MLLDRLEDTYIRSACLLTRMRHDTTPTHRRPTAPASLNHQTHPRTSPPPTQTHATCLFLFPLPNELTPPGPSRCFPFWQEVLACYVTNTSPESDAGKIKCQPVLEDYYECLHHKKEVRLLPGHSNLLFMC